MNNSNLNKKFRDGEKWQETEQNKETDFIKKFQTKTSINLLKLTFMKLKLFTLSNFKHSRSDLDKSRVLNAMFII